MQDILSMVNDLKRHPLLVRAARFGVEDFNRELGLKRILGVDKLPRPGQALLELCEKERALHKLRIARSSDYAIARHVELLTAIMVETHVFRASCKPNLTPQSAEADIPEDAATT